MNRPPLGHGPDQGKVIKILDHHQRGANDDDVSNPGQRNMPKYLKIIGAINFGGFNTIYGNHMGCIILSGYR